MAELILTNGDSAAELLRQAGRVSTIMPWRDILHEGPIIAGTLETSSVERVAYLARRFRIGPEEIAAEFAERDALMRAHDDFESIELWFEHDLYDQLQLIQILTFFADEKRAEGLTLVQADDFLGAQRPDTILRFTERSRPITQADLDLAAVVWTDLAAPTPERIRLGSRLLIPASPFSNRRSTASSKNSPLSAAGSVAPRRQFSPAYRKARPRRFDFSPKSSCRKKRRSWATGVSSISLTTSHPATCR